MERPHRIKAEELPCKKLGRPVGSKDKVKRGRRGYLLRYASPALREKYTK